MISLGKQLKQVDDLDLWCSVYLLDKNLLMFQVTTKPSISKQLWGIKTKTNLKNNLKKEKKKILGKLTNK